MDWLIIFTSLNHLALFLLSLYGIAVIFMIAYLLVRYHRKHQKVREAEESCESAPVISKLNNSHWFGSFDAIDASSQARNDSDNLSIMTVTTISDVYKDCRISVELNERFFLK